MNPLKLLYRGDLCVFHVRLGGCGGCEWAVDTLLRDGSGPGAFLECSSPRHSRLLLVTGLLTGGLEDSASLVLEQAPGDSLVVAVGDCALGRGLVAERLKMTRSVSDRRGVDLEVPGCPVTLESLVRGIEDVTR